MVSEPASKKESFTGRSVKSSYSTPPHPILTMSSSSTLTLLVTGATGQLGRQVVEFLLAADSQPGRIVAGSRQPEKLADLASRGVITRELDLDRPETLATAFAGVDRLLLISTDALGRRIDQHRAAISAAVAAGVKHVVYTSIPHAEADSVCLITPDHYATEQAIHASGLGYTILRNSLYIDNLLSALPQIVASGQWFHAAGDGKIAQVTRQDCARIAAAALAADFDGRRTLDVTGPELLDHAGVAAQIAEVAGRPVAAVPVDADSLIAGLTQAGLPELYARVLASFDAAQARGEYALQTTAIRDLTGHDATPIRDFLTAHRHLFVS